MKGNKVRKDNGAEKNNRPIVSVKEIDSGTLEDNNAYTLTIGIPGRGKIKIKVTFEKEKPLSIRFLDKK